VRRQNAMRGSTQVLLLFAALSISAMTTAARADDNSTIEERMSYKDFTRLGLDKLSPDQLRGLNEWMKAHGGMCPPGVAATGGVAPAGTATNTAQSDKVTSKLVGEFKGWEKGTVLKLANGTAWEVRDDEAFIANHSDSPEVTVERGLIGGWRLSVAGYNEIAHVLSVGK
jgi:hypothetical protein